MRSRVGSIFGLVVVAGAAAFIAWRVAFRDTATPVSASDVVEEAVADPPVSTTGGPAEGATVAADDPGGAPTTERAAPALAPDFVVGTRPGDPGLYVYATTGFEEIDALSGPRHDYPGETFITIQPGGCGTIQRWTALEERWDEVQLCPTEGGLAVATMQAFHRWFGQADLQVSTCTPATAPSVPFAAEGMWAYGCSNDSRSWAFTVEVVGVETLDVGGTPAAALRVREVAAVLGATVGSSRTETWYLQGTSLVLRREVTRGNVSDSAIGSVTYEEEYVIELIDLTPRGGEPAG